MANTVMFEDLLNMHFYDLKRLVTFFDDHKDEIIEFMNSKGTRDLCDETMRDVPITSITRLDDKDYLYRNPELKIYYAVSDLPVIVTDVVWESKEEFTAKTVKDLLMDCLHVMLDKAKITFYDELSCKEGSELYKYNEEKLKKNNFVREYEAMLLKKVTTFEFKHRYLTVNVYGDSITVYKDGYFLYNIKDAFISGQNVNITKEEAEIKIADVIKQLYDGINKPYDLGNHYKADTNFDGLDFINKNKLDRIVYYFNITYYPADDTFKYTTDKFELDENQNIVYTPEIIKYKEQVNSEQFKTCYTFAKKVFDEIFSSGYTLTKFTRSGVMCGKGIFTFERKSDERKVSFTLSLPAYNKDEIAWREGLYTFSTTFNSKFHEEVNKQYEAETYEVLTKISTYLEYDLICCAKKLNLQGIALVKMLIGVDYKHTLFKKNKKPEKYTRYFSKYKGFYTEDQVISVLEKLVNKGYISMHDYRSNVSSTKECKQFFILDRKAYHYDLETLTEKCNTSNTKLSDFELERLLEHLVNKPNKTMQDYMMLTKVFKNKSFMAYKQDTIIKAFKGAPEMIKTLIKGMAQKENNTVKDFMLEVVM